jgi:predicted enzyme related to lactoylglutathione lyase
MFYVKDLEKAMDFYGRELGLKKAWHDAERKMVGFVFEKSDSEIVIHSNQELPSPDFSFLVDNVQDFCQNYKQNGYQILEEPFEVRCGKFAILADLDGNKLPIIDLTKFGGKARYTHIQKA